MNMSRSFFLQKLSEIIKKYKNILIYDEVLTGFGRTGEMFACEKSITSPDIICLSKGLTGGFLPLSLTITTKKIFNSFLGNNFDKGSEGTSKKLNDNKYNNIIKNLLKYFLKNQKFQLDEHRILSYIPMLQSIRTFELLVSVSFL